MVGAAARSSETRVKKVFITCYPDAHGARRRRDRHRARGGLPAKRRRGALRRPRLNAMDFRRSRMALVRWLAFAASVVAVRPELPSMPAASSRRGMAILAIK